MITVEVERGIKKHEQDIQVANITRFNKSTSKICTIRNNMSRWSKRRHDIIKSTATYSRYRKVLDKREATNTMTNNFTCETAKALYAYLVRKLPSMLTENEEGFIASREWFENFNWGGIHGVVRHGEVASSDTKTAEASLQFQKLMSLFFHCNKMGIFWKMQKRSYIIEEKIQFVVTNPLMSCSFVVC